MSLRAVLLAFWVVWGAWLGGARADTLQAIPALQAHVTDTIGLLPEARRAALETRLADLETRKGAQLAVLVVASTQPEDIAAYSIRVVEAWKLGRAKVDDGVLFLIARDDRRLRIEVGRGLEGAIPDAVAKRIIAETVAPRFKAGDFPGGIEAGVEALTQLIDGETLPESEPVAADDLEDYQGVAFIGCIVFAFIGGAILKTLFGRLIGAGLTGGVIGAVIWAVTSALVFGVFAGIIGFVYALGSGGSRGRHVGGSSWGGGAGGFSGGFGGGGDSGSSGWSGGGGDFGGGGASGDW